MGIDNQIYNRIGDSWWDEDNPLNLLHGSFTAGRFAYFRDVLQRTGRDPVGRTAVDIGSGGGFLAEEFARLGCRVIGLDPSEVSVRTALGHARSSGLDARYVVATGERLPLADEVADVAYCCDVLEHVSDLDRVIAETARVLKPGGIYLFDTINRTLASKLLVIKVMQEWNLTRIIDTELHSWAMFIKPAELEEVLHRHGLHLGDIAGLGLRANKLGVLRNFARARRGTITMGQLSRAVNAGRVKPTNISYLGFATKPS
ncbi:bifunctional 2-polyprenyl-6-hydroxyphenol methylase/3-demethylubiquinol 3-O-methyltransferase UbiG [Kribbella sp. NPDC048915]|uniref:bifunctional 2-polyprenyl-6-hydroxyphenol methylase/3-demethylubiquinol 3-O-methyltransferase UbiG n=1 Tax=Kribbella sp. NPDC048915 TaxID=3155148 RepID=UPI00340B4E17